MSPQGKAVTKTSNDLVKLRQDDLTDILTFDEAVKHLAQNGYTVETAADLLSDGFTMIEKAKLVNRPFVIVDAKVSFSKEYTDEDGMPARFVICKIFTKDNGRFRFTDGSAKSGLANQIMMLEDKRKDKGGAVGVVCHAGLAASKYDFTDPETGKVTPATTYYLNTEESY